MRIAIAGFLHESNTFAATKTDVQHFRDASLDHGPDLLPVWEDAHHELGGFIAGCREHDVELVPILAASATPGGPLTEKTYETIVGDLLKGLEQAGRFDGLLLALHGAMVSDNHANADGETVERVRTLLGPEFPIVMSLDMHANVSRRMVECPTATVVYRTYPHVDQRERGSECASLIVRAVRREVKPTQAFHDPRLLIHIVQQYSEAGAMKEIMDEVRRVAGLPGVLSASFAPGFVYADVPDMGAKAVVVADGDRPRAAALARDLAEFAWARREALNARLDDPATSVRRAAEHEGPVALMDCGDNVGGGGPGDSTLLFAELLEQGVPNCLVVLYDPDAAAACARAGVRARVRLEVGGKTDDRHGRPIPVEGVVRCLADGKFVEPEPRHGGIRFFDQGLTAVLETDDRHTIVLTSMRVMPSSIHQLRSAGIHPEAKHAIIVKGVTAPRAAYDPICRLVIPVDTPGVTQAGPEAFTYHRRPKPLYPLDPMD